MTTQLSENGNYFNLIFRKHGFDINWPVQAKSSYDNQDYVDVIDIEDEDHSFAAFFIGMKTGPSPYVKRPLVCSSCFTIFFYFQVFIARRPAKTIQCGVIQ